jgi:hypothetical protein
MIGGKKDMDKRIDADIDKISDRATEIYSTSLYGIKESIAKAKLELSEKAAESKIKNGGMKNE